MNSNDYIEKAKTYFSENDNSKTAEIKLRKLLIDECRDIFKTTIQIQECLIHKYDCKCVYSIKIYISQRKKIEVLGSKKTYYDMYTDIRSQLIDKINP